MVLRMASVLHAEILISIPLSMRDNLPFVNADDHGKFTMMARVLAPLGQAIVSRAYVPYLLV
jgi:hypothetical protein